MGDPAGEADNGALRLDFDRRLLLQFRGSSVPALRPIAEAGVVAPHLVWRSPNRALEQVPDPLTSLREKLIKIGAKVVSHGRYVTFQMAEVAVPRQMFADILSLIARLRAPPASA